jgi:hypothetical protein
MTKNCLDAVSTQLPSQPRRKPAISSPYLKEAQAPLACHLGPAARESS